MQPYSPLRARRPVRRARLRPRRDRYARAVPGYDDATLQRLLDLQAEDTAIARLRERKEALPEAKRLAEVQDLLSELEADLEIARKQNDELGREQSRIE